MRTTVSMDEDVHEFVTCYAGARGLSLSAAVNELIRKGENAPEPPPDIRRSPNGFPLFPPAGSNAVLTGELVKKLEGEAFDPKSFA